MEARGKPMKFSKPIVVYSGTTAFDLWINADT